MSTRTTYTCDICGEPATILQKKIQLVFTTEQNEGWYTTPYLEEDVLDLCKGCLHQLVTSHPLTATGAMGHNTYTLKEKDAPDGT